LGSVRLALTNWRKQRELTGEKKLTMGENANHSNRLSHLALEGIKHSSGKAQKRSRKEIPRIVWYAMGQTPISWNTGWWGWQELQKQNPGKSLGGDQRTD